VSFASYLLTGPSPMRSGLNLVDITCEKCCAHYSGQSCGEVLPDLPFDTFPICGSYPSNRSHDLFKSEKGQLLRHTVVRTNLDDDD
jgi:hypothetical protein